LRSWVNTQVSVSFSVPEAKLSNAMGTGDETPMTKTLWKAAYSENTFSGEEPF